MLNILVKNNYLSLTKSLPCESAEMLPVAFHIFN